MLSSLVHAVLMDNAIATSKCYIEQLLHSSVPITSSNFKNFSNSISDLIVLSSNASKNKFGNKSESIPYKSALIFHFSQLISSLQLLARIISSESKISCILKECRRSICNRINFCLNTIREILTSDNVPISQSGCFLQWMDDALEKITLVDIGNGKETTSLKEAKSSFEDVLAHAMSIAQICLNEDSKAIKGSSQAILESFEELEKELLKSKPNKAMVNLFVENCGNKLCSLERKVDIAVLRLSLQIFSKYVLPLEEVFKFCEKHSQNEFEQLQIDNIVADFDLHVDRIMQIGLFAVFCSSNIKSGIKIRDRMASLEFLEPELIPAALMLLTENSEANRTSAVMYKNYWLDEANKLKQLIFEIIDPSTFCQVIYDRISTEMDSIVEKNKSESNFSKNLYDNIVNFGGVLIEFVLTAMKTDELGDDPAVTERVEKCCLILREINKAIEVLDDNSAEANERILKRCRIFKAEMKKLLSVLTKGCEDKEEQVEDQNNRVKNDLVENKFFNHLVQRGKDILQNRSILYRTPNKTLMVQPSQSTYDKSGTKKTVDSFIRRLSAQKLNFSFDSSNEDQSFDLHITEILDNLNDLASSFLSYNTQ